MFNSSIQYRKQQLFRVCAFTVCSKCPPLAFVYVLSRQRHCLMAESMTYLSCHSHSSTTHCRNSLLISVSDLLFVHTLLHHCPYFARKHVEQAFASYFYSARNARIASAVLATAIPSVRLSVCPSVRPSVRPSHASIAGLLVTFSQGTNQKPSFLLNPIMRTTYLLASQLSH